MYEFANALKIVMSENENICGVFGGNINENVKAEILQNFDGDLQKKAHFYWL
ncbi:MAG: hypothetical protein ACTTJC_07510 [Campylobacter sp.]